MKSKVKGMSSERIAESILKKLGYTILEKNKKITLAGIEAFEVDFIVENANGIEYIVEVKAGKGSVSDLRQLYADSKILNLRPLLVCKGLTDEAATTVVNELNIKVVTFNEFYLLLEPEELETIIRSAVKDVLNEYGFSPLPPWDMIGKAELRILQKIAISKNIDEATSKLHIKPVTLGKKLGELRGKRILPQQPQNYSALKKFCQQILYRYDYISRLDRIEKKLR